MLYFVEEFLLEAPDQYRFLTNGNVQVAGIDDRSDFADTMVCYDQLTYHVSCVMCICVLKEAMAIMGMTDDEVSGSLL